MRAFWFAAAILAWAACARASEPGAAEAGVLVDGARVVFLVAEESKLDGSVIDRFGDRVRDQRKGVRAEFWLVRTSAAEVMARLEGDVLGRRPTHIVVVPGEEWGAGLVGHLLGRLEGANRVAVLFWPEEQMVPQAVPMEGAPALDADTTTLLLPGSLLRGEPAGIVDALARVLGV